MAEKKRRGKLFAVIGAVVLAVLVMGVGALAWGRQVAGTKLPQNTTVAGVDVGGVEPAQAKAKLQAALGPKAEGKIAVTAGDQRVELDSSKLGLTIDYDATLAQAGVGETSWNPVEVFERLFGGSALPTVVDVDADAMKTAVEQLAKKVDHDAANAAVSYKGVTPQVAEGSDGVKLDVDATAEAIKAAFLGSHEVAAVVAETPPQVTTAAAEEVADGLAKAATAAPVTVAVGEAGQLTLGPETIAECLSFSPSGDTLTAKVDEAKLAKALTPQLEKLGLKKAQDAKFTIAGKKSGKPKITKSVDGQSVDFAAMAQALLPVLSQASGRQLSVEPVGVKADFSTEDAEAMGVKEITGEFTTYFPGSAYRYNNIGKAAGLINGVFLKPGETFSMNQVLGERTKQAGWMPGGGIANGKIDPNIYGGGISQSTTTTFNAIFFAGLEDVYHKPHSLYFSRYPMGREATLDWKSVDMKFRNDSKYGVLMQAWITGQTGSQGSVTVRVWSTKVYDIKATKPIQSNFRSPGATVYDSSAGCIPQDAMTGFDVKYSRQFYLDGKLVKTEPFKWSYNSLTPVVCGKK
ncbi:MAG: VanW family protein [Propionibacteriaceae bacterium]|jgi:vancomycin resistance protein YoaR|nr:VanW family protein [Propionibacteriaceae bacterium]